MRLLLVPLTLVLVVALPLAQAHPVCVAVERATDTRCFPDDEPCSTVAEAITNAGRTAAATCEEVL